MSSKEELLKYLISSKEYISSNELAEYFNVSKKTVYRRCLLYTSPSPRDS